MQLTESSTGPVCRKQNRASRDPREWFTYL
jgi:hypothetical protein